jgi:hypothetical protein
MVNERPDGKTDAHFGRSGALTGVKHMGREISTRDELGTDSLRSNHGWVVSEIFPVSEQMREMVLTLRNVSVVSNARNRALFGADPPRPSPGTPPAPLVSRASGGADHQSILLSSGMSSSLVLESEHNKNVCPHGSNTSSPHTMADTKPRLAARDAPNSAACAVRKEPSVVVIDNDWTPKDEAIKQLVSLDENWPRFTKWPTNEEAVAIFYAARDIHGY